MGGFCIKSGADKQMDASRHPGMTSGLSNYIEYLSTYRFVFMPNVHVKMREETALKILQDLLQVFRRKQDSYTIHHVGPESDFIGETLEKS